MDKIAKFLSAIWADWLARMSGPITVPFTLAALLLPSTAARIVFALLAVTAALVTCYRIWVREYDRAEVEKGKNEAAPHMDLRWHNAVSYSKDGSSPTDVFFYVELVLGEPSQVVIDSFSLDVSDQGQSMTTIALDDVCEWQWVRNGNFKDGVIDCEPIKKLLATRGDPVRGWIHFPLPNLSSAALARSLLTLNVNCEHGTCYVGIDGARIQLDPQLKGLMWKKAKVRETTSQPADAR